MWKRIALLASTLALTLSLPLTVAAAPAMHGEGSWKLPDGSTAHLSKVTSGGVVALAGGQWHSGCYYAATNPLGNVIYSYTIWQDFGSDGSKINYLPAPAHSSTSDLGWSLSTSSDTHWWINTTHKDAAARGSWTFQQYISGGTFRTAAGWVQVQDNYKGTWSCYSS